MRWIVITLLLLFSCKKPLDIAVENVREEAEYITKEAEIFSPTDHQQYYKDAFKSYHICLAAMNYVQSHINSSKYGYILKHDPNYLPVTTDQVLRQGAGICGQQAKAFNLIVESLGLKARLVEFYWIDERGNKEGHVESEVFYAGKWRYFSPTWGAIYRKPQKQYWDLMSLDDIKKELNPEKFRIANMANGHLQLQIEAGLDPFLYLKSK